MDVIIIGNGFDLAHNLPTKYTDFMDFTKIACQYVDNTYPNSFIELAAHKNIHNNIINYMKRNFGGRYAHDSVRFVAGFENLKKISASCKNNFWMQHFIKEENKLSNNWIDFEHEIALIIKLLDKSYNSEENILQFHLGINNEFDLFSFCQGKLAQKTSNSFIVTSEKDMSKISNKLLIDLNEVIENLEWYLNEFADKNNAQILSQDIFDILEDHRISNFIRGAIDDNSIIDEDDIYREEICVISFNYTHTFKKLYDSKKLIEYDFIHGEIRNSYKTKGHSKENNNMVLGIEEYLPKELRNKKLLYIKFKKYYQRIFKKTGCKYKSWPFLNEISNVYIFGHSLDYTDRDILREIITAEDVTTTIFYYNEEQYAQQISNLVKLLNQEKVIEMVYGKSPRLVFKLQKPMTTLSKVNKEISENKTLKIEI